MSGSWQSDGFDCQALHCRFVKKANKEASTRDGGRNRRLIFAVGKILVLEQSKEQPNGKKLIQCGGCMRQPPCTCVMPLHAVCADVHCCRQVYACGLPGLSTSHWPDQSVCPSTDPQSGTSC